jgi:uncharacterized protein (DUF1697 family)
MVELASLFEALGHQDVVTHIQSGNVIFRSSGGDPKSLAAALEERLAAVFELQVAVLLRTTAELGEIVAANPFLEGREELPGLHVAFLDRVPLPEAAGRLDPGRSPPDEFRMCGREVYLRYPNGMGRSKLTIDYLERSLGVRATVRNWNTVTRLLELAER